MPGLTPGARVLEDELGEEAVDVRPDGRRQDLHHARVGQEGAKGAAAMQLEDLGHPVLGLVSSESRLSFFRHESGLDVSLRSLCPRNRHDLVQHDLAHRGIGERLVEDAAGLSLTAQCFGQRAGVDHVLPPVATIQPIGSR